MKVGMLLSPIAIALKVFPPSPGPCPVCALKDGFHDHRLIVVDPKYHKEKGWHKQDE